MKALKLPALMLGTGLTLGLAACGGHGNTGTPGTPAPPAQPQNTVLSVNDVKALAVSQLDTNDPIALNGGKLSVTPVNDEMSDPQSVN